ncbi:ssl1498 family light-harvesting-like protein [Nodosilinea sp. P-1105]|uniref:photosystem II assembly protein Psb34 n=1 Tax=Nodosilinea sp. P-1105 TaxID=2546229 RepID=UPI00146F1032|nr:ssl1498 family light-harvesting-like protein [Nodosilinea sp. P-1105]NMF81830.1 ssl1498 family light-harvesting-like protein [Nodosilinea sp. P-1105]
MTNEKAQAQDANSIPKNASDGSELIPAEVKANLRHDDDQLTSDVAIPGTTVDDEGLINNFATEPTVYPSTYPSPRQQRRYIFLGAAAILLVAILVLISVSVS